MADKSCGLVCYEISRKTGLRNPSRQLQRSAIRIDGSVWEYPLDRQPQIERALAKYKNAGATVEYRVYDEGEFPKVQARAMAALAKEADRIRESLAESLVIGHEKMQEAERLQSAKLTKRSRRFVKSTIAKAKRELRYADECALAFDITGDVTELFGAVAQEVASRHSEFFGKAAIEIEHDSDSAGGHAHAAALRM